MASKAKAKAAKVEPKVAEKTINGIKVLSSKELLTLPNPFRFQVILTEAEGRMVNTAKTLLGYPDSRTMLVAMVRASVEASEIISDKAKAELRKV